MPLDPSIILKVNTPAETQQASNQAALGVEQVKQAQNTTQQIPVANQTAQATLTGDQLKNQAAQLEQQQSKLTLLGQLVGSATDQTSYDAAKQRATQMGLDTSTAPANFDPNYVKTIQNQSFTAAQRIQMQQLQTEQDYKRAMIGLSAGRLNEKTANDSGALALGGMGQSFIPTAPAIGAAPNPNAPVSATNLPAGTLTPPTTGASPTTAPDGSTLSAPQFAANGAVVPNPQNSTGNAPNPAAPMQDLSKLQGKAYADALQQQNPGRAAQLLQMANGEMPIPRSMGKNQNPVVTQLYNAYPDVTSARNKTFQDFFGGGKPQQQVNALGTAIGHAGELLDKIQDLHANDTLDSQLTNFAANLFNSTVLGNDQATNFHAVVRPLANEIESAYKSGGGTQGEVESQIATIGNPNATKKQQLGALNEMVNLLASKTQSFKDQYDTSMQGAPSPRQFVPITLGRQAILDKIKAAATSAGAHVSGGSTGNTQAAPLHPALATPQAAQVKANLAAGKITQEQAIQQLQAGAQ